MAKVKVLGWRTNDPREKTPRVLGEYESLGEAQTAMAGRGIRVAAARAGCKYVELSVTWPKLGHISVPTGLSPEQGRER